MTIGTGLPIEFSDVTTEIYGTSNTSGKTLNGAFAAATGAFNSSYSGSKNSLLNFRGYNHTPLPNTMETPTISSGPTYNSVTIKWTDLGYTTYKVYINGVYHGATSLFIYPISGLNPLTTYNITVSAVNSYGEGPQSSALSVTTLGVPYTGTIINTTSYGSNVAISVNGNLVAGGDPNRTFTFYAGNTINVTVTGPSRVFLDITGAHNYFTNNAGGQINYSIPSAPAGNITFTGDGW